MPARPDDAVRDLLTRQLEEYHRAFRKVLTGLTPDERRHRPGTSGNHIDFLAWHLLRNEDQTVSLCDASEELWSRDAWCERFALPPTDDGCGYTSEQVEALPRFAPALFEGYLAAVRAQTSSFLGRLAVADLDRRPIPGRHDVPVAHLLSHLVVEQSQHLGQIAYVRGLLRGQEFATSWGNPETPDPA